MQSPKSRLRILSDDSAGVEISSRVAVEVEHDKDWGHTDALKTSGALKAMSHEMKTAHSALRIRV